MLRGRWRRLVSHLDLGRRQNPSYAVDKLERVLLCPEIYVQRLKAVVVFVLVVGIKGREMPLVLVHRSTCHTIDDDTDEALMIVRVSHLRMVKNCSIALVTGWLGTRRDAPSELYRAKR